MTSAGRSFTFDHSLGCWLCLTDACGSIQQSSSYATCNTTGNNLNKSAQNDNLPLASLMYLTPNQTPRLQNNVPAETKALANVTHCRNLRLAAEYLNSPKEYQYWLLAEIKQLATNGDVDGKFLFYFLLILVKSAAFTVRILLVFLNNSVVIRFFGVRKLERTTPL